MVLTTGAQRELYLQINVKESEDIKYLVNTETNEKIEDTLDFYYYIYDENHTPYDEPKMDSLDGYDVVLNDGSEVSLDKYLEQKGYYSNYYAVISNHTNITSIEHFRVGNHDNFYSIQINYDVANLLNVVGIDNVWVDEYLDDDRHFYLPTTEIRSGYELLFFLTTNNNIIIDEINHIKYEIISNNLKQMIRNKINQGLLFVLEDNTLVHLTYTLKDRLEIEKSINRKLDTLINNGKAYIVTKKDLNNINRKLKNNEINYNQYLNRALEEPLEFWSNWREWGEM